MLGMKSLPAMVPAVLILVSHVSFVSSFALQPLPIAGRVHASSAAISRAIPVRGSPALRPSRRIPAVAALRAQQAGSEGSQMSPLVSKDVSGAGFGAFPAAAAVRGPSQREIGIVLPNNQRQHHTLHIQKDVQPYTLC